MGEIGETRLRGAREVCRFGVIHRRPGAQHSGIWFGLCGVRSTRISNQRWCCSEAAFLFVIVIWFRRDFRACSIRGVLPGAHGVPPCRSLVVFVRCLADFYLYPAMSSCLRVSLLLGPLLLLSAGMSTGAFGFVFPSSWAIGSGAPVEVVLRSSSL